MSGLDIQQVYDSLSLDFFFELNFNKLMNISKMVSFVRARKYKRGKGTKYGESKAMYSDDLEKFFCAFKPNEFKYKVFFLVMAWLGLRISETAKLRIENLDLVNKRILVKTEKQRMNVSHALFLHEQIFPVLADYVSAYEEDIVSCGGWIFPAGSSLTKSGHISSQFTRKVFRRVCDRAGLSLVYGERETISGLPFRKAKLYLYSPHSLRHSLGCYLAQRGVKVELIQKILRHKSILNTMVYVKPSQDEVDYAMYKAFRNDKFIKE